MPGPCDQKRGGGGGSSRWTAVHHLLRGLIGVKVQIGRRTFFETVEVRAECSWGFDGTQQYLIQSLGGGDENVWVFRGTMGNFSGAGTTGNFSGSSDKDVKLGLRGGALTGREVRLYPVLAVILGSNGIGMSSETSADLLHSVCI
uniref:Uncharacterized protein n=1 Tax=Chromera velia CCMP2878 TaxID=1169474 RepID=A0A0G4F7R3_9ALVE|eukprot:Cvel_15496.t1-p1 / transcript=Cvel_15496.t1 / gene=Cvel_15496 / organism=Chromera_velia_CCMP2878 / gene_product=hypothetical protein / transcript_product=hypothetical protein / location=Cvel_scaffold1150:8985-9416(-) / protein_length=144 / sequence_SO=supercontig / SO=protein_coding / is_pseudo=false